MQFLLSNVSEGRVFGLDQQTLIQIGMQLLNTAFLAFVLARLLYKPVRNYLKKRSDGIQAQFELAENDKMEANNLKSLYEQKLKDIEAERMEILDTARKFADEKSKLVLNEAKSEAGDLKNKAAVEIEAERERVRSEMQQIIIEASAVMAEKFIKHSMDKNTQDKLFAQTMNEMEETVWQN